MAKHITEAEIATIDPSHYRTFLVFQRTAEDAQQIGLPVLPAFHSENAPAAPSPVEQLFIQTDEAYSPELAKRLRTAIQERAMALNVKIWS